MCRWKDFRVQDLLSHWCWWTDGPSASQNFADGVDVEVKGGVSTNLMPPFFSREYNYNYTDMYVRTYVRTYVRIKVSSFTNLRLFSRKVFLIINNFFPPLLETLYAGCLKLFATASELFTHPCSSSSSCAKRRILGASFRGPKIGSQRVLNWDCGENDGEQIEGADCWGSSLGPLKDALRGRRFVVDDEQTNGVREELRRFTKEFHATDIQRLTQGGKCIDKDEDLARK